MKPSGFARVLRMAVSVIAVLVVSSIPVLRSFVQRPHFVRAAVLSSGGPSSAPAPFAVHAPRMRRPRQSLAILLPASLPSIPAMSSRRVTVPARSRAFLAALLAALPEQPPA